MSRYRTAESAPISWLHVAGLVVVLWAVSSDALSQVREGMVTEVRGTAVRASTGSSQIQALDTLKVGDRVRLSSDSHVSVFTAEDAQLYLVDGPAEVTLTAKGVLANGKPVAAKKLNDAYRNVKVNAPELVQGSMVMRGGNELKLIGPEGLVSNQEARQFAWTQQPGSWRLELSSDSGDVVYRADASNGQLELPPEIALVAGNKYVWGVLPALGGTTPADWTEFTVAEEQPGLSRPGPNASSTDRVLYAAWLKSRGLERAALRAISSDAR